MESRVAPVSRRETGREDFTAVARRKPTNFSRGMKPTTGNQPTPRKQPGVYVRARRRHDQPEAAVPPE
ncbi:hypothetical protein BRC65_00245 [Halobacteriales archaeon QH_2_65_14]|nr:MAG: hypothetical protein BRC65_00245 [Halobacteriales archaeon QH_2_65_14]